MPDRVIDPPPPTPSPSRTSTTSSWRPSSPLGQRRAVPAGEVLFSPADDHYDWIVILSGAVDVLGPDGELITTTAPAASSARSAWSPASGRT